MTEFQRSRVKLIEERMAETTNPLIQVVVGARQTGKSTMIAQALSNLNIPNHSISADDVIGHDVTWLTNEWQQAKNKAVSANGRFVFVVDEIQKVKDWPNVVKGLWDSDMRTQATMKVFLSGSSTLLIRKGLQDSLQGRFEIIYSPHWSYSEMKEAFGYNLDDFLYFGGFPGAARFHSDEKRWLDYMKNSIIEPTISQDVLGDTIVKKPALMRALFELGSQFSAQELSFNKMLGQLQDAGNTTTLANYLELMDRAEVMCGLQKFSSRIVEAKKSSPRLMVYDTALMSAGMASSKEALLGNSELRGHLVETAVGAYLLARSKEEGFEVYWWRNGNYEVDFVLKKGLQICAIEVKSGRIKNLNGMSNFLQKYPNANRICIGGYGSNSTLLADFLAGKTQLFL